MIHILKKGIIQLKYYKMTCVKMKNETDFLNLIY